MAKYSYEFKKEIVQLYIRGKEGVLLVCDDTIFVKIKDETTALLAESEIAIPYKGAKRALYFGY